MTVWGHKSSGFTLIEVLVTLSIVALAFAALTGFTYVQVRQSAASTRVLNEIATIEAIDAALAIAHGSVSELATQQYGPTFRLEGDRLTMLAASPQILNGPSMRQVTWQIERKTDRGMVLIYRWRPATGPEDGVILADQLKSASFETVAMGERGPKAIRLTLDLGHGRGPVTFDFLDQTVRWSIQP
jgi:prepilin-type N-terminal cleavage/methylation domain-containing protein